MLSGGDLKELSIFVDESGSQSGHSRFCLVALLFHDQSDSINELMSAYGLDLSTKGLPNIPFHASPLMNGRKSKRTTAQLEAPQTATERNTSIEWE